MAGQLAAQKQWSVPEDARYLQDIAALPSLAMLDPKKKHPFMVCSVRASVEWLQDLGDTRNLDGVHVTLEILDDPLVAASIEQEAVLSQPADTWAPGVFSDMALRRGGRVDFMAKWSTCGCIYLLHLLDGKDYVVLTEREGKPPFRHPVLDMASGPSKESSEWLYPERAALREAASGVVFFRWSENAPNESGLILPEMGNSADYKVFRAFYMDAVQRVVRSGIGDTGKYAPLVRSRLSAKATILQTSGHDRLTVRWKKDSRTLRGMVTVNPSTRTIEFLQVLNMRVRAYPQEVVALNTDLAKDGSGFSKTALIPLISLLSRNDDSRPNLSLGLAWAVDAIVRRNTAILGATGDKQPKATDNTMPQQTSKRNPKGRRSR